MTTKTTPKPKRRRGRPRKAGNCAPNEYPKRCVCMSGDSVVTSTWHPAAGAWTHRKRICSACGTVWATREAHGDVQVKNWLRECHELAATNKRWA